MYVCCRSVSPSCGVTGVCVTADHFVIFSKPHSLPLVAFGLKKVKDPKSGKLVDRWPFLIP